MIAHWISSVLRARRLRRFWDEFHLDEDTRVLDVGGTPDIWRLLPHRPALVMSNIVLPTELADLPWVIADGRHLPFADKAFDVVFSNSVIEHLGSPGNQQLFADECRRVGGWYCVQTPNKYFPVEPHLLVFLVHLLPRPMQRRLLRYFSVWGWCTRPTRAQCDDVLRWISPLGRREMAKLFPGAEIRGERVFGFTKSLIAVRR